jgi:hypothetical protein
MASIGASREASHRRLLVCLHALVDAAAVRDGAGQDWATVAAERLLETLQAILAREESIVLQFRGGVALINGARVHADAATLPAISALGRRCHELAATGLLIESGVDVRELVLLGGALARAGPAALGGQRHVHRLDPLRDAELPESGHKRTFLGSVFVSKQLLDLVAGDDWIDTRVQREILVELVHSLLQAPGGSGVLARLHAAEGMAARAAVRGAVLATWFGRRLGLSEDAATRAGLAVLLGGHAGNPAEREVAAVAQRYAELAQSVLWPCHEQAIERLQAETAGGRAERVQALDAAIRAARAR